METGLLTAETLLLELLIVVVVVAALVRRVRIPYTVALVLVGLSLAILPISVSEIALTQEVILLIFLPPLVFEAAFHLDIQELRNRLPAILVLAIAGVLLSTAVIGGIVSLAGMPLAVTMIFGAIVSATDPVAVIATFKKLGVPRQLQHIVEGESLLNDGTAIVLTTILVQLAMRTEPVTAIDAVLNFLLVTLGGVGAGLVVGLVVMAILPRIDDYLVEITLTTIAAFGTYVLAERLRVSGVMAVVTAGVLIGNYGRSRGMSPTTRIVLEHFWEYVAFLANSLIFLLIGLTVDFSLLADEIGFIAVGVVAALAGRAVAIYGLGAPIDRVTDDLPLTYRHVLFWGGLRGAIALALALALPDLGGWRSTLLAMVFGVVLFTLLVQGTTIQWLLNKLGVVHLHPARAHYEVIRARLYSVQTARRQLQNMNSAGMLSPSVWQELDRQYQASQDQFSAEIQQMYELDESLKQEELVQARVDGLRSQRSALQDLVRRGLLSESGYEQLLGEIDQQWQNQDESDTEHS